MIWATVSSWSCFCWLYKASPSLAAKNIISLILVLTERLNWTEHTTLASLVAQRLKRLPPMWETRVRSLGREDPLEKEMAIHSNILAWRILWMEKPSRLQSMGSQRVGHDWATSPSPERLSWTEHTTLVISRNNQRKLHLVFCLKGNQRRSWVSWNCRAILLYFLLCCIWRKHWMIAGY